MGFLFLSRHHILPLPRDSCLIYLWILMVGNRWDLYERTNIRGTRFDLELDNTVLGNPMRIGLEKSRIDTEHSTCVNKCRTS